MTAWQWLKRTVRTLFILAFALTSLYAGAVYALNPEGRHQQKRLFAELERLHAANVALAERNERLRLQIAAIRYDDRYLEHVAREDLGLVNQGEVIYRFLETRTPSRPRNLDTEQ